MHKDLCECIRGSVLKVKTSLFVRQLAQTDNANDGVNEGVNKIIAEGVNEGTNERINEGVRAEVKKIVELIITKKGANALDIANERGKSMATIERYLRIAREFGMVAFKGTPKTGDSYVTKKMESLL